MKNNSSTLDNIILTPEKAVIIDRTAIIADLHLGFENVMQTKGIALPRLQIREISSHVEKIIEKYRVRKIIIAGDLKHEFSRNLPYEWEDVKAFLRLFQDIEVSIVRGNHDNFLAAILAEYGIELKEYDIVRDFYVVHGHREAEYEKLIMGHEHPAVRLRIRGAIYSFPCYLVADETKIVLPAFSPLMPGSNVLQETFLSPILQKARKIEIYAIESEDVVYLGTVENLRMAMSELD